MPKTKRLRRPSPAMIVACIGLGVALSGTTYAATALPRGSVGTPQLKSNAVVSAKVKNGSLRAIDFPAAELQARGASGGDLSGTYPNPTIGAGKVKPSNLAVVPAVRATDPRPYSGGGTCFNSASPNVSHVLIWRAEEFDTAAMHAVSDCSDPTSSRLTAPIAGIYAVDAGIHWIDLNAGERSLGVRVNAAFGTIAGSSIPANTSGNGTQQSVSTLLSLAPGDYVETLVHHDTAGANFQIGGYFTMHWIGPQS